MNVFVIGAHGQVGQLLLPKLKAAGYQVFAGIRKDDQAATVKEKGATPVHFDLMTEPQQLALALQGMNAVVFTAGSGGNTGDDMTMLVDLDGAVKAMEATKLAGIKRFIMVSAAVTTERQNWGKAIRPYMAAKFYADRILERSGLAYTIVRPGHLSNGSESGFYVGSLDEAHDTTNRANVAAFITAVLGTPSTVRQAYDVFNGKQALAEAFVS